MLSKISKANDPHSCTPVVRLLRGAAAIVDKRRSHSPVNRPGAPSITPQPRRQLAPANSYRIALLSEVSVDDAIVVSALTTAPFCCHADLLTMSAPQLTAVARVLNESLPLSLRINTDQSCPPGQIRVEIETVVGLRRSPGFRPPSRPSVQPSSQSHPEHSVSYRCRVDGESLMNHIGNMDMAPPLSPECRPTTCEPTSQASLSPVVRWSYSARTVSHTDVVTLPSYLMRLRLCRRKN